MELTTILLLLSIVAAAFFLWRFFQTRRELRDDLLHLTHLLRGRRDAEVSDGTEKKAPGRFEQRLLAAGLRISPVIAGSVIVLLALVASLALATSVPRLLWAAPLVGLTVAWLAIAVISEIGRQRAWRFENRLADGIDLMVGALMAGENLVDALASAASGTLEPVRAELREVVSHLRSSMPIEDAVSGMAIRYDSEGVRLFTQLLIAKWEIGGPLAPALQAVNRTIRSGLRLRGQLLTQVSGAQTGAIIVAIIPYLLIVFFIFKRPAALARLWSFPWGPDLLVIAVLLQVAGFVWLRRILRTEL